MASITVLAILNAARIGTHRSTNIERLAWAATRTRPQPYRVITADA
jgi:hypothetical protein